MEGREAVSTGEENRDGFDEGEESDAGEEPR